MYIYLYIYIMYINVYIYIYIYIYTHCVEGVKPFNMQATPRETRPEDLSL